MASIRDVAQRVGCSISTVSRVINCRDAVDPKTRQRVLQAIEQLGYRPNLIAQGLRIRGGRLLGLVLPVGPGQVFSIIAQHFLDAACKRGYNVVIVNSHENPDLEERSIQDLLRRNVNGIVFSRVSDESRAVNRIAKEAIPIVVMDRALEHESVSNVVLNNYRAGFIAGSHLTALGHRSVGCITGPLKIALCRERLKGFGDALDKAGIAGGPHCVCEGDFQFQSGLDAVERMSGCSAIWAMNDMMAFGVLKGLYRMALRVPGDVSLVGMDDNEFAAMTTPSLTTVRYPFKDLAEKAAEIVTRKAEEQGPRAPAEMVVLEPELVIRNSTGRPGGEGA